MSRKYGSKVLNATGQVVGLHEMLKIGDSVIWNGRKYGSCEHDSEFQPGNTYPVCYIYDSNCDIELSVDAGSAQITIRAHDDEYSIVQ
ncbi:hypothetical protein [Reinekea sp. G2M2-21]|uniref:hypothetical protein n=1 Tax=Reinekea sp. G2M2-21 TaxID=2788942 RepID=UPI0018AC3B73|nr:hypothetical protein [Reinekea sp. G2M2-21]